MSALGYHLPNLKQSIIIAIIIIIVIIIIIFPYNIIYITYVMLIHKRHVFELSIERIVKVYNTLSCINIIHIDLYYHPTSGLMQILRFDWTQF